MVFIPKKSTQYVKVGERTSGWKRFDLWIEETKGKPVASNSYLLFRFSHMMIQYCFSKKGLLPCAAPADYIRDKADSEEEDINEHGIHIWKLSVLVAHQILSIIRMLLILVSLLLNCLMQSEQKLSQQLSTDRLLHKILQKIIMVEIYNYIGTTKSNPEILL